MKAALALLLVAAPSLACDWKVTKKPDPMTDKVMCMVSSPTGKVAFYRLGDDPPKIVSGSAYSRAGTTVRVDDHEAIYIGPDGYSGPKGTQQLLEQLKTGSRMRVQFRDYPHTQNGDTEVCNLLELLESCPTP